MKQGAPGLGSMDNQDLKGLIGSVGKNLGAHHEGNEVAKRLEGLASPQDFREFLESADLGVSEPTRSDFIEEVTGDEWEDYRSSLAYSVDLSYHEFNSPSA